VEEAEETKKEMARDWACWDENMAAVRHNRECYELASERHHRIRLARYEVSRAHHNDTEGGSAGEAGWDGAAM
jgi:hypothetical protein